MMMEDEAKRAIMELNGCMLNGNRLNVEVHRIMFMSYIVLNAAFWLHHRMIFCALRCRHYGRCA